MRYTSTACRRPPGGLAPSRWRTVIEHTGLTVKAAVARQQELRQQVLFTPLDAAAVRFVAGADVSATRQRGTVWAGVVVYDLQQADVVDCAVVAAEADFPYVPGLLAFRELPPLLEAWRGLRVQPEVLLCDGHGLAHPRRCGLACHAGLELGLPTIGCAKSRYIGTHADLPPEAGSTVPLVDGDEVIGEVVRTRHGVRPIYVSVGHRCRLADAVALTLRCVSRYRLPEPTRWAHQRVNEARRAAGG